jgi:hypothetical protein
LLRPARDVGLYDHAHRKVEPIGELPNGRMICTTSITSLLLQ